MENKKSFYYQQGDVLLHKCENIPEGAKSLKQSVYTLAEGEATGHSHTVMDREDLNVFEKDGVLYLDVKSPVEVSHQEHGLVTIQDPGIYKVDKVNEYDHFEEEVKKVQD